MHLGSGRNGVGWDCVSTGQRRSQSEDTILIIWDQFWITLGQTHRRTYVQTYRISLKVAYQVTDLQNLFKVAYQVTESTKTCGLHR